MLGVGLLRGAGCRELRQRLVIRDLDTLDSDKLNVFWLENSPKQRKVEGKCYSPRDVMIMPLGTIVRGPCLRVGIVGDVMSVQKDVLQAELQSLPWCG